MITQLSENQIDRVMDIWLAANKNAHGFISEAYWKSHFDIVKNNYLPHSKTYVYMEDSNVCGFVSVLNSNFIGALFVAPECQRRGIGALLLSCCKEWYPSLRLCVYVENERAVSFYLREGFQILSRAIACDGNHEEYSMIWEKID